MAAWLQPVWAGHFGVFRSGFGHGLNGQRVYALSRASEAAQAAFRRPVRKRYVSTAKRLRRAFMAVLQGRPYIL